MTTRFPKAIFLSGVFVLWSGMTLAQKPAAVPLAPVPAQILAAKKIFIANAGGDEMAEDDPIFTGGPDRAYNQFYADMKSWGHYQIVATPAEADLLLEIRQEVSTVLPGGKGGGSYVPQFGLKIRDPKTNALLWASTCTLLLVHGRERATEISIWRWTV